MQSAIKTALVATALALTLAGCETIGERTELGENAQIGAAVGSAAVGLVAILADAHPAIAVGAALLGGVGGGFLGDRLEEDDPNSED